MKYSTRFLKIVFLYAMPVLSHLSCLTVLVLFGVIETYISLHDKRTRLNMFYRLYMFADWYYYVISISILILFYGASLLIRGLFIIYYPAKAGKYDYFLIKIAIWQIIICSFVLTFLLGVMLS